MKKILIVFTVMASVAVLVSCNSNMNRDAKRLAHKTELCYSLLDGDEFDDAKIDEFGDCYEELDALMAEYEDKYSEPKQSKKFLELYMKEIRKSEVSDEYKQLLEDVYLLGAEEEE